MKKVLIIFSMLFYNAAHADCGNTTEMCVKGSPLAGRIIGSITVNNCAPHWWEGCNPCWSQQHWDNKCNITYSECNGNCHMVKGGFENSRKKRIRR